MTFNQCGLPKEMALELFERLSLNVWKILAMSTLFVLQRNDSKRRSIGMDVLEEIIKVISSSQSCSTLHRLGISSIWANIDWRESNPYSPLVCSAFNADFDGDQMLCTFRFQLKRTWSKDSHDGSDNIFLLIWKAVVCFTKTWHRAFLLDGWPSLHSRKAWKKSKSSAILKMSCCIGATEKRVPYAKGM